MSVDSANSKVREICDLVLKETLEPAREEANRYREEAKAAGERIIHEAMEKAARIEEEHKRKLAKELEVHEASIQMAINKGLAKLKEEIMHIFGKELDHLLSLELQKADVIAELVNALVTSIEKEGTKANLQVCVPNMVSLPVIQSKLLQTVKDRLGYQGIVVADVGSGCVLKLVDRKMSIAITDESLKDLLGVYLEDLRERLFSR